MIISYLTSPDREDALSMDEVGVAEIVKATLGEDLGTSLEPHGLTKLHSILLKDFREDAPQSTQHGPSAVNHFQLTVPGKGLGVSR